MHDTERGSEVVDYFIVQSVLTSALTKEILLSSCVVYLKSPWWQKRIQGEFLCGWIQFTWLRIHFFTTWNLVCYLPSSRMLHKLRWVPPLVHFPSNPHLIYVVLPSSLITKCLTQRHNPLESLHRGIDLTLNKIRKLFYFYKMRYETELFVNGCVTCAKVKQPKAYQKLHLSFIMV